MLILYIVLVYLTGFSELVSVRLSQSISSGKIRNRIHTHYDGAFINPFNILKSYSFFKTQKRTLVEYDESQISKTVNLPKNIWPSSPDVNEAGIERQKRIQKYWNEENVYHKLCENRLVQLVNHKESRRKALKQCKIIYDGPPYANGMPHFGHFLNKTIKDVFVRFFLLEGSVPLMVPGWDCHGMPIEHKILKMYNSNDNIEEMSKPLKNTPNYTEVVEEPEEPGTVTYLNDNEVFSYKGAKAVDAYRNKLMMEEEEELSRRPNIKEKRWSIFIREKCKEFAYRSIKAQMTYFKNSGIWAFWNNYYATYHSPFERMVIDNLIKLKDNELIYQEKTPQYFSSESKSVLADSEILTRTEKVMTCYISFPVDLESCTKGRMNELKEMMNRLGMKELKLVAWTTTSYTIPGNKGIAVNPKGKYQLYKMGNRLYIMSDFILKNRDDEFWSKFEHIVDLKELVPLGMEYNLNNYMSSREVVETSSNNNEENSEQYRDDNEGQNNGQTKEMDENLLENREDEEYKDQSYFIYGSDLEGVEYYDPVYGEKYRVYSSSCAEMDKGTGMVHLSPAHGFPDFEIIKQDRRFSEGPSNSGFSFCNLFDRDEKFLPHIHPQLVGKSIRDMDEYIVLSLVGENLLNVDYRDLEVDIDWRCENKVHTRLTRQYLLSLPPRDDIVDVIKSMNVQPKSGENYLSSIVKARSRDWCLSRQRFWGTPIPYDGSECMVTNFSTDYGLTDRIWRRSKSILDTVDVWFESGMVRKYTLLTLEMLLSCMLRNHQMEPGKNLLKYLENCPKYVIEGQDQHRGWFQSMIIVHMMEHGNKLPFENLFSHMFVKMKDQKLSKSKMSPGVQKSAQVLEGRKELVVVNSDVDVINKQYPFTDYNDEKINYEFEKIKHTISPGYGLCRLMDPEHPYLSREDEGNKELEKEEQEKKGVRENNEQYRYNSEVETKEMDGKLLENREKEEQEKKGLELEGTEEEKNRNWSNTYFNVDVLRTLVCSNDFLTHDLELSKETLRESKQSNKKVVNCFKYLISVLVPEDYDPDLYLLEREGLEAKKLEISEKNDNRYNKYQLNGLDLYFLNLGYELAKECKESYLKGQFFKVLDLVERFITTLSNVYFSYSKNFTYVLSSKHPSNQSIRFVMNKVLYVLLKVLGPILPHMCEDIYMTLNPGSLSLFESKWPEKPDGLPNTVDELDAALSVRKAINKEHAHSSNRILRLEENELAKKLHRVEELGVDLGLIFNVAGVEFVKKLKKFHESGSVKYEMVDSGYTKCKRCWLYREDVLEDSLCGRCRQIMKESQV